MAGSTNFPTSLDSHTSASPLGFGEVNNQAYTLSTAAHTNSVTTITVASTSKFPSKGYLVVKREIISYTGKTATTFTGVTRGVGGTTAAAFLSGTLVEQVPVAANHNDLAAGIVAIETKLGITSSTPTTGTVLAGGSAGSSAWTASPTVSGSLTVSTGVNVNTTGAAAGEVKTNSHVKAGGAIYPGGQETYSMAAPASGQLVADAASIDLGALAFGVYLVINNSTGQQALVFLTSAANTVVEIKQTSTTFDLGTGTDNNKVNIYHDGTSYLVKNQTGSSQYLTVLRVLGV